MAHSPLRAPSQPPQGLLQAHGPLHIDDLLSHLPDHNAGTLSALLLMLELSGAVRRLPGAVYEACPS